jgi:hypothetical protein
MEGIKCGNAIADGSPYNGWVVGRFIVDDAYRQTHDVEVKWGIHAMGEANDGFAADQVARTLSILIRGRLRLTFRRKGTSETVLLEKEGDYALWLPGMEHSWLAEAEPTVVLTIRWPSFPAAQIRSK